MLVCDSLLVESLCYVLEQDTVQPSKVGNHPNMTET